MTGFDEDRQRDLARLREELEQAPAESSIDPGFRALGRSWLRGHRYTVRVRPADEPGSSPRNLVFCFDGSWNDPLSRTNVHRLSQLLIDDRRRQQRWYYSGVGVREDLGPMREAKSHWRLALESAATGWFGSRQRMRERLERRAARIRPEVTKELLGGASGKGAARIRRRACFDLLCHYRPGDRIFLFGFSRGAAIARLVANQLAENGIPETLTAVFEKSELETDTIGQPLDYAVPRSPGPPIEMLGAWDTVASFGLPGEPVIDLFKKDLTVAENIRKAYHLVAVDERRRAFAPTLMRSQAKVEEVWFPGVHTNVGGGYVDPRDDRVDHRLSDLTLRFMIKRARDHGLLLRAEEELDPPLAADCTGPIEPSPWPGGHEDRQIRVEGDPGARPRIHRSVFDRRAADLEPSYRPAPVEALDGRWQIDSRD